jgi:hypothetical protein
VPRGQRDGSLLAYSWLSRPELTAYEIHNVINNSEFGQTVKAEEKEKEYYHQCIEEYGSSRTLTIPSMSLAVFFSTSKQLCE